MTIVSLSVPGELLNNLDSLIKKGSFTNRSEVMRYAIRDFLSERIMEIKETNNIIATITTIYDREAEEAPLLKLRHKYDEVIKTSLHEHLDERNCLEVIIVDGLGSKILNLLNELRALKGTKHAKLSITTSV
jgi:CopG family nickel-responsive transcriptional regulator